MQFQSVSVGESILCAIATSGHAFCWGQAMKNTKPEPVSGDLVFRSISSGLSFACGVSISGAAYCWGGLFSEDHKYAPVRIQGNAGFDSVSSSTVLNVACGIATDGAGYCWGDASGRRLGPSITVPVRVEGATLLRSISVAESGVLSIGQDGITYLYPWDVQKSTPRVLDSQIRFATIDGRGLTFARPTKLAPGIVGAALARGPRPASPNRNKSSAL